MLSFSWNLALRRRRNDTHYEIIGVDSKDIPQVPDDYINMVLVPHLKVLLGVEEVELKCKVHETRLLL